MRRIGLIAIALTLVVVASAVAYWRLQPKPLPSQIVYGSGRIEADEIRLAPEVGGRLSHNRAVEGQDVQKGALVAQVDPSDYELEAQRADSQRIATLRTIAQLDAQIALSRHHAATARTDLGRYEALRRNGWVTARQLDAVRNTYEASASQIGVLRQQRAEAEAQTDVAAKSLALSQSRTAKARIFAPITGAVLDRLAEPGEVVAPGQAVAIIADLKTVRLKIFVPERDLGKLRLDSPARIMVDAFPDRDFPARLAQIDQQAQFTPRDVHVQDERSRTVYGVTLEADNRSGLLKPGMPADAWILWDEGRGWPKRLKVPE